jgi:hypothetical protein
LTKAFSILCLDIWLALCYTINNPRGKEVNQMTDREALNQILEHLDKSLQPIITSTDVYVEIENACLGEDIVFEFDKNGNILSIGS